MSGRKQVQSSEQRQNNAKEVVLVRMKMRIAAFIKSHDAMLFFVIPSFVGVIIFLVIPLIDVFRRSFCMDASAHFAGLSNYSDIFQNEAFLLAAKNTVKFEIVCLPLLLVISLLTAVGIQESGSAFLKYAMLVPMAIPSNSIAVIWKILFDKAGIINGIFVGLLHIPAIDFLNSNCAFWVLVFTYLWKNIGYNMLIWMAGLSNIPKNIYEAAVVDGANDWDLFFKITLPNLRNVMYAISVLSFVNSFKVYREAYLISGNYPNSSIYILQHLFNNWFQKLDVGKLAAGSVVTAVFLFTVLGLLRRIILKNDEEGRKKPAHKKRVWKNSEKGEVS